MMNDNASPRKTVLIRGGLKGLVAGAVLCSLWLAGCDEPAGSTVKNNGGGATPPGSDSRCSTFISSSIDIVQPDRLSISSEPEDAVGLLNQWRISCGVSPAAGEAVNAAAQALLERLLSEEQRTQIEQEQFVVRDALSIRDAILFRKTLDVTLRARGSDLDRITELFAYVTRTVHLVPQDASSIPFTPFHVMVFGRGAAQDRAWIFAEMLRQMRIDAVILETGAGDDSAAAAESSWLVGVLLDDEVYLFDAQLGWPIPSPEDDGTTPTVRRPATLREVGEHPDLLRRLDLDDERPYPIRADQLETARVRCIGQTSLWSKRMQQLQAVLSGDNAVVVSDPLPEGSWGAGLIGRVAQAAGGTWAKEDVGVWSYPERQLAGYENRSEVQTARIHNMQLPFNAPKDYKVDKETKQVQVLGPQRLQLKTRIGQLLGDFKESIQAYMVIRTSPTTLRPLFKDEEDVYMHVRAAEDAFVWSGACQFEQGNYDSAARTFRDYLRSWPSGAWRDYCRRFLALCEVEQGDLNNAIDVLEATSEDSPQRRGDELLIRRWRKVVAVEE